METNMSLIFIYSSCLISNVMLIVAQPLKDIVQDNPIDSTNNQISVEDYLTPDEISELLQHLSNNQQPDKTAEITIEQLEAALSLKDTNGNSKKFKKFASDSHYISEGNEKISYEKLLILLNRYNQSQKLKKLNTEMTNVSNNFDIDKYGKIAKNKRQSVLKSNNEMENQQDFEKISSNNSYRSIDSDEEVSQLISTLGYDNHVFFGELNGAGSNAVSKMSDGNKYS